MNLPIPLGTLTPWGTIEGLTVDAGNREYVCVNAKGTVTHVPESLVIHSSLVRTQLNDDDIFFCLYCTVERVDPDFYPYCSKQCSLHAEHS
jgi:hypothetical protein